MTRQLFSLSQCISLPHGGGQQDKSLGSHRSYTGRLNWGLALCGGGPPAEGPEQQCEGRRKTGGGYPVRALTLPHPTLQDSIKKFERELRVERHMILMEEKQVIVKRQQEEISRLMQTQVGGQTDRWTVMAERIVRMRANAPLSSM